VFVPAARVQAIRESPSTKAAQRVRGVLGVENQIDVEILTHDRREDADLRGDVLQALMLDARIPTSVDATVKDGGGTLSGPGDWRYQLEAAEFVAANVPRVASVQNRILLSSRIQPDAADIEIICAESPCVVSLVT